MRIIPIVNMDEELIDLIQKRAWYSIAYKKEKDYMNIIDSSRIALIRKPDGEFIGYCFIDFRDMDDGLYFICYCELRKYDEEADLDYAYETNKWGDYIYAPITLTQKDTERVEEELNLFYLREDKNIWTVPAYMRNKDIVDYEVEEKEGYLLLTAKEPMESEFMNVLEAINYVEFVEFNDGRPVFKTNPEFFLMDN